jgi:hypothetical protein
LQVLGDTEAGALGLVGQADNSNGFTILQNLGNRSHGRSEVVVLASLTGKHRALRVA